MVLLNIYHEILINKEKKLNIAAFKCQLLAITRYVVPVRSNVIILYTL